VYGPEELDSAKVRRAKNELVEAIRRRFTFIPMFEPYEGPEERPDPREEEKQPQP